MKITRWSSGRNARHLRIAHSPANESKAGQCKGISRIAKARLSAGATRRRVRCFMRSTTNQHLTRSTSARSFASWSSQATEVGASRVSYWKPHATGYVLRGCVSQRRIREPHLVPPPRITLVRSVCTCPPDSPFTARMKTVVSMYAACFKHGIERVKRGAARRGEPGRSGCPNVRQQAEPGIEKRAAFVRPVSSLPPRPHAAIAIACSNAR
jgi:hypothetical protein